MIGFIGICLRYLTIFSRNIISLSAASYNMSSNTMQS